MKKILFLLIICVTLSSCDTITKLYDGTNVTYDLKKNKVGVKTKVNKHFTVKY